MKLEGPTTPEKPVNDPDGWLGISSQCLSQEKDVVLKKVAVRGLPMDCSVGVMEHAWLLP
jgi:hypothetical protein